MRSQHLLLITVCLLTAAACTSTNTGPAPSGTTTPAILSTAAVVNVVASTPSQNSTPSPTTTDTSRPPTRSSTTPHTTTKSPTSTSTRPATLSSTSGPATVSVAGHWTGTYQSNSNPAFQGTFNVTFTQKQTAIAGTIMVSTACVDQGTVSGQLRGNVINFGAVKATENVAFDGTIRTNSMSGHYQSGPACGNDKGTWTATRN